MCIIKKRKDRKMKKILISLLCFILTITTTAEITYISIANSITKQEIKTSIKENLLTGLMYDKNGNKTEIFNTILRLTELDEETVKKIMDNETANNIITDIVESIYDYNLTGDETVKYTESKIINLVNNNIDKVLKEIDYPITKKEREEALTYTNTHTKEIIDIIYSTDIGDYTK